MIGMRSCSNYLTTCFLIFNIFPVHGATSEAQSIKVLYKKVPKWSDHFSLISAVETSNSITSMHFMRPLQSAALPNTQHTAYRKPTLIIGDASGSILDAAGRWQYDTGTSSTVTALTSTLFKGKTYIISGHENGDVRMHSVTLSGGYEASQCDRQTSDIYKEACAAEEANLSINLIAAANIQEELANSESCVVDNADNLNSGEIIQTSKDASITKLAILSTSHKSFFPVLAATTSTGYVATFQPVVEVQSAIEKAQRGKHELLKTINPSLDLVHVYSLAKAAANNEVVPSSSTVPGALFLRTTGSGRVFGLTSTASITTLRHCTADSCSSQTNAAPSPLPCQITPQNDSFQLPLVGAVLDSKSIAKAYAASSDGKILSIQGVDSTVFGRCKIRAIVDGGGILDHPESIVNMVSLPGYIVLSTSSGNIAVYNVSSARPAAPPIHVIDVTIQDIINEHSAQQQLQIGTKQWQFFATTSKSVQDTKQVPLLASSADGQVALQIASNILAVYDTSQLPQPTTSPDSKPLAMLPFAIIKGLQPVILAVVIGYFFFKSSGPGAGKVIVPAAGGAGRSSHQNGMDSLKRFENLLEDPYFSKRTNGKSQHNATNNDTRQEYSTRSTAQHRTAQRNLNFNPRDMRTSNLSLLDSDDDSDMDGNELWRGSMPVGPPQPVSQHTAEYLASLISQPLEEETNNQEEYSSGDDGKDGSFAGDKNQNEEQRRLIQQAIAREAAELEVMLPAIPPPATTTNSVVSTPRRHVASAARPVAVSPSLGASGSKKKKVNAFDVMEFDPTVQLLLGDNSS